MPEDNFNYDVPIPSIPVGGLSMAIMRTETRRLSEFDMAALTASMKPTI